MHAHISDTGAHLHNNLKSLSHKMWTTYTTDNRQFIKAKDHFSMMPNVNKIGCGCRKKVSIKSNLA